ncbi:MAG TPA: D-aminoacylase [Gemmatimonadales bacterium]|nr:D-aminoacylase [Gemmatimonadales bacterium]
MPTRRLFLATAGRGLVLLGAPALKLPSQSRYDLVLRSGTVFDGTGATGREADVAIAGDRIVAVGRRLRARGREEIDVRDRAVAPGFSDLHSHADGTLFQDPRAESVIRQGITTVVVGADGGSRAPGSDGNASFQSFFDRVREAGSSVNVATMVGLGRIRRVVIGETDRRPTPAELERMTAMVQTALASGACGASTGLEYTPGAYATTAELIALCRPLVVRRLPYATHMRDEEELLLEALDEAIAIARGAGCRLQISHLKTNGRKNWSKFDGVISRIERAKSGGMDVAFDRYPYVAWHSGLTVFVPVWALEGGSMAFLRRLDDPATAPRIRTETFEKVETNGGWNSIQISEVEVDADRGAVGQRLDQLARTRNEDPYETMTGLLRRNAASVGVVGFGMSEENLERFLRHPLGMACTDGGSHAVEGPARSGHPHPRGLGSYPRILGRYVRERKVLTLEEAVWKMSGFPASRVRLGDRGRLAAGLAADVVVFDPATVTDRATFEQPFQYPEGLDLVIVNGAVTFRQGTRDRLGAGRPVRPG